MISVASESRVGHNSITTLTGVTSNRTECRNASNFIHLPTCLPRLCSTSPLCFSVFFSAADVRKHTQRAYSIHIITTVCDYYTNTHDNMYGAVIVEIRLEIYVIVSCTFLSEYNFRCFKFMF